MSGSRFHRKGRVTGAFGDLHREGAPGNRYAQRKPIHIETTRREPTFPDLNRAERELNELAALAQTNPLAFRARYKDSLRKIIKLLRERMRTDISMHDGKEYHGTRLKRYESQLQEEEQKG
jgi:hypothetical protein